MEPQDSNTPNMISNTEDDTNQDQPATEKVVFKFTPDQSEVVHLVINNWIKEHGAKADDFGSALYDICLEHSRNHPIGTSVRLDDVPPNDVV